VAKYDDPAAEGAAARACSDRICNDGPPDTASAPPAQLAPDAPTAAGWGDKPTPRQMGLRRWRPMHRATLRGFADVELSNGFQIDDVAVHVRGGRAWASLPARPMLDQDGRHIVRDRKPQYATFLRWRTGDLAGAFSTAVVELVRAAHPGALDEAGP
jgi:hypothetical protein